MNVPAKVESRKVNPDQIKQDIILFGDYSKFTREQEAEFILWLCQQLGLSPISRPIEFITFDGRRTPYVKRDGTDQLRKLNGVSVTEMTEADRGDVYIVKAKVQDASGRTDIGTGSVFVGGAKGNALANLLMKAETKAKRRATLSICGLGFLDESEIDEVSEKMTKPPAVPQYSRAHDAAHAWEAKATKLIEEIQATLSSAELAAWKAAKRPEISVAPDEIKKRINDAYDNMLADHKTLEGGEVVWDTDTPEPRPASESDEVEDKPSITERAIAAREAAHPLDIPANLRRT